MKVLVVHASLWIRFLGNGFQWWIASSQIKLLLFTHDILKFSGFAFRYTTFQSHISENQAANHWTVWVSSEERAMGVERRDKF